MGGPEDELSAIFQHQDMIQEVASQIIGYRTTLIEAGIQEIIADQMALQFHNVMMTAAIQGILGGGHASPS